MGILPVWILELWMVLLPDNNDIAKESSVESCRIDTSCGISVSQRLDMGLWCHSFVHSIDENDRYPLVSLAPWLAGKSPVYEWRF